MTQRVKIKTREVIALTMGTFIAAVVILHGLHLGTAKLFNMLAMVIKTILS